MLNQEIEKQIRYAKEKSSYYREKLKDEYGDIRELPFTSGSDIADDPYAFLCIPLKDVERIHTITTSGTDRKKKIFFSENDVSRNQSYLSHGMGAVIKPGDSCAVLFPQSGTGGLTDILMKALADIGVSSETPYFPDDVEKTIHGCGGKNCIIGMPSDIMYILRTAPELKPESVLLSGDYIPEAVKNAVRDVWNAEVYEHYGMTETGFGGALSDHTGKGMLIRSDDLFIETVDPETGAGLGNGEPGELVITTLNREAMPLIRYRTGDIGVLSMDGKYIKKVFGRNDGDSALLRKFADDLLAVPNIKGFTAHKENGQVSLSISRIGCAKEMQLPGKMRFM